MKLLKFGAVWCNGCIEMKPRCKEIEAENPWVQSEFFDYDERPDMVEKYDITKELPTFVFLDKDGNEIQRMSGVFSKEKMLEVINANKDK